MDVPHIIAGRFRIECEIGKGGMGTVYRATHLGLERPVAVKIIKAEYAFDPDLAERFMREARTMARLRHSHAAMIFDAGSLPDGRHFIVMEFVEGETLSEALARECPFTPERAVKIAADVCCVLAEAHSLGIVHRDLKPSNIMLNERGICVLDFGVAKVLATSADATATHATTGPGMIVGTPRYMSPEQCLGHRVGARSDLYSLGVLLYEMLTGHPPFVDTLPSAVLVKQATAPPPPLWEARPGLPPALVTAVHALLAKRAEQRPASALIARELLERSILRPKAVQIVQEPFAGMLESLNAPGRGFLFKAATPAAILLILLLGISFWGAMGPVSQNSGIPVEAASLTPAETKPAATRSTNKPAAAPTTPAALTSTTINSEVVHTLNGADQDAASDIQTVVGKHGSQIVAIREEPATGRKYFFALERAGDGFATVRKAFLDVPDFKSDVWTSKQLDVDGDGFDEVVYMGRSGFDTTTTVRMIVYSPRRREVFALRAEPIQGSTNAHLTMSPNLRGASKNFLRRALEDRLSNVYTEARTKARAV